MNRRRFFAFGLGTALVLALAACPILGPDPGPVVREGNVVSGTGTIVHFEIEGGFHAIRGDDGAVYDPLVLPAEYREDGLRVRFRARIRDDVASFHMVGTIVELLEIARL